MVTFLEIIMPLQQIIKLSDNLIESVVGHFEFSYNKNKDIKEYSDKHSLEKSNAVNQLLIEEAKGNQTRIQAVEDLLFPDASYKLQYNISRHALRAASADFTKIGNCGRKSFWLMYHLSAILIKQEYSLISAQVVNLIAVDHAMVKLVYHDPEMGDISVLCDPWLEKTFTNIDDKETFEAILFAIASDDNLQSEVNLDNYKTIVEKVFSENKKYYEGEKPPGESWSFNIDDNDEFILNTSNCIKFMQLCKVYANILRQHALDSKVIPKVLQELIQLKVEAHTDVSRTFGTQEYVYHADAIPSKETDAYIFNYCIFNKKFKELVDHIKAKIGFFDFTGTYGDGRTLLIIAAQSPLADQVVEYLLYELPLKHQNFIQILGIDAQDASGRTAMHYFAAYGKDKFITRLVELGANPNINDKLNLTPLSYTSIGVSQLSYLMQLSNLLLADTLDYGAIGIRNEERIFIADLIRKLNTQASTVDYSSLHPIGHLSADHLNEKNIRILICFLKKFDIFKHEIEVLIKTHQQYIGCTFAEFILRKLPSTEKHLLALGAKPGIGNVNLSLLEDLERGYVTNVHGQHIEYLAAFAKLREINGRNSTLRVLLEEHRISNKAHKAILFSFINKPKPLQIEDKLSATRSVKNRSAPTA